MTHTENFDLSIGGFIALLSGVADRGMRPELIFLQT
jgi:hypothetical protein